MHRHPIGSSPAVPGVPHLQLHSWNSRCGQCSQQGQGMGKGLPRTPEGTVAAGTHRITAMGFPESCPLAGFEKLNASNLTFLCLSLECFVSTEQCEKLVLRKHDCRGNCRILAFPQGTPNQRSCPCLGQAKGCRREVLVRFVF